MSVTWYGPKIKPETEEDFSDTLFIETKTMGVLEGFYSNYGGWMYYHDDGNKEINWGEVIAWRYNYE